jgi:hypothetical protein
MLLATSAQGVFGRADEGARSKRSVRWSRQTTPGSPIGRFGKIVDNKCGHHRARLRTFVEQLKDLDMAGLRPRHGPGLFEFADCPRTVLDRGLAADNPWPLPVRDRGLTETTDCSWTWTVQVHGLSAAESSPQSSQCHGHAIDFTRTLRVFASTLRGHKGLVQTRGQACPIKKR